jgi:hypothetical protein
MSRTRWWAEEFAGRRALSRGVARGATADKGIAVRDAASREQV